MKKLIFGVLVCGIIGAGVAAFANGNTAVCPVYGTECTYNCPNGGEHLHSGTGRGDGHGRHQGNGRGYGHGRHQGRGCINQ